MNTPESIQLKKSIDAIDSSGYRSAKNAGFTSRNAYSRFLEEQRKSRAINIKFSAFLNEKLAELNISQDQLAKLLDVTAGAVSRYAAGYTLPQKSIQEKLFRVLNVPYKTLDDFMKSLDTI